MIDETLGIRLRGFVSDPRAVKVVNAYFDPVAGYDGRWFDQLDGGGARPEVQDRITAEDIVAVSMLSVNLPPRVSWRLLHSDGDEITALLRAIPTDVDLWNADDDTIGPNSPADRLWRQLRSMGKDGGDRGNAWVTAGKLLARKRPRLVPIYDREVKQTVGLRREASWWLSLGHALTGDVLDGLRAVAHAADLDESVSTIRVLDVILWMQSQPPRQA